MEPDRGLRSGFRQASSVEVLVLLEINGKRPGLRLVLRGALPMQSINVRRRNLQHATWMLLVGNLVHWLMNLQRGVVWDKLG